MNDPGSCEEVVPRLMSVTKAAAYLGVPKKALYYWVETKQIVYVRVGRSVFFERGNIEKWLARCRVEAELLAQVSDLPESKRSEAPRTGR